MTHRRHPSATRKTTVFAALGAFALSTLTLSTAARADDDEIESGRVIAVQGRPYRMVHEFAVSAGVLPVDALYTGLSLGGSYTLHFSDIFAWEAIGFHYSGNIDTGLKVTLAERWSVAPTTDPKVEYLLGSHLVFTPMFGKLTIFNSNIVYASTYLAIGGGIARFSDGFRPQVSAGPGIRLFFGQVVSTRLDVRSSIVPDIPSGVDLVMQVTLSVCFNFGTVRATESGDGGDYDSSTGFEALDELYPLSNPDLGKKSKGDQES